VHDVKRAALADELAQALVLRGQIAANAAHVPNLAVAHGLGHGDVDAVLVDVQTDVPGARFAHGPSPRNCATTRPTVGPVHWCSSARPWRATYDVAGGGPPGFTKPSCIGHRLAARCVLRPIRLQLVPHNRRSPLDVKNRR